MASGNNGVFVVPQFSGKNYHIWIVKMRSCLKPFGLWEYVDALIISQIINKIQIYNTYIQEEIYVEQLASFIILGHEEKFYRLYKALYGLKQALRVWYNIVDSHFLQNDFKRGQNELTLYMKDCGNRKKVVVSFYVDDLLIIGDDVDEIEEFKKSMLQVFEMQESLDKEELRCSIDVYCKYAEQLADILIKTLPIVKFNVLRSKLGVLKKSFKEEC
uniref:Retrovirus-related Pol polyprotein from transposon TNT 1-94 n=1 Tax=Cajanus cajan TaxID=3821 RepID=A0A151T0C9_CAJCA|nr:Retrovirus-related Pol polyprotein from transposon TNT 1-94 [Cajanus cajan]